jgi:hypothetical protein
MKTALMAIVVAILTVAGCAPVTQHQNPFCHEPLHCDGGGSR